MTSILERIVAIIAPHRCICCGNYNNILCADCASNLERLKTGECIFCNRHTKDRYMCQTCVTSSDLSGVWACWEYRDVIKNVIKQFKFDHARDAHKPLAFGIAATFPHLDSDWVVVTIPTVSKHIRERGYDHAFLLAKEVARLRRLPLKRMLRRKRDIHQRGATRKVRLQQTQTTFEVISAERVNGRRILLVDDVCTTGATLRAAAKVLKNAGATEVRGAVAAWKR